MTSLGIFNNKLEHNHLTICGTYDCITSIYIKIKKYEEVIKYSRLSLDIKIGIYLLNLFIYLISNYLSIYLAKLGDINSSVGTTCSTLAIAYGKLKLFDDSLKYYHISLNINIKLFGNDDLSVANIYNNMAIIYKNTNEYDESIEMYQKSLEIRISNNGILQNIYDSIASVYLLKGDYYESLKNYKISYDINRLILGIKDLSKYLYIYITNSLSQLQLGNEHEIVLTILNNMEIVKKSIQSLQVNKELPNNILFPIHLHNLNIMNNYENPGTKWKCNICNKNGVGIKYYCGDENCHFECHPQCCCDKELFTFDIDFDLIVIE
jgi:tetratricopeptide (TPR) repeat protein